MMFMKIKEGYDIQESFKNVIQSIRDKNMSNDQIDLTIIGASLRYLETQGPFDVRTNLEEKSTGSLWGKVPVYSDKEGKPILQAFQIIKSLQMPNDPNLCELRCKLTQTEFRSVAFAFMFSSNECLLLTYTFLKPRIYLGEVVESDITCQNHTKEYSKLAVQHYGKTKTTFFEQ